MLSTVPEDYNPYTDQWSVVLVNFFQQHPDVMYSLEEAAEIVHMNPRTLAYRFKQITGESIRQYQLNQKLNSAYEELRSKLYTVKEVALKYGFCDPYYFSNIFKKKFGFPPSRLL